MQYRHISFTEQVLYTKWSLVELKDLDSLVKWTQSAQRPACKISSQPTSYLPGHMLCPLLQSPAVKAIVNCNDHSASQPLATHTYAHTHMHALSTVFAPGVLTKQETAGTRQKTALPVRSTCSLILTPGGAWRHCHRTPSLYMAHTLTQIHKSIDRHRCQHTYT